MIAALHFGPCAGLLSDLDKNSYLFVTGHKKTRLAAGFFKLLWSLNLSTQAQPRYQPDQAE